MYESTINSLWEALTKKVKRDFTKNLIQKIFVKISSFQEMFLTIFRKNPVRNC